MTLAHTDTWTSTLPQACTYAYTPDPQGVSRATPEVKGGTGVLDYGFRNYLQAIGRFLEIDPLAPQYPELTPYQFASNTPIQAIDLDGLEGHPSILPPPGSSDGVIQAVDNTFVLQRISLGGVATSRPLPPKTFIGPAYDRISDTRIAISEYSSPIAQHFEGFGKKVISIGDDLNLGSIAAGTVSTISETRGTRINAAQVSQGFRYIAAVGQDIQFTKSTDIGIRLFEASAAPRSGLGMAKFGRAAGRLGVGLSAASFAVDLYSYSEGEMSGGRLGFHGLSLISSIAIGSRFGGPAGLATSAILTTGEYLYDNPPKANKKVLDSEGLNYQFKSLENATDNPDFFSSGPTEVER